VASGGDMTLRLVSTFILARILIPEDFGLVGMVTALTAIAAQFSQLGLSTVTVQRRDITHRQVTNLFWINVALGAGLSLVFCALSPAIAAFYRDARLVPITMALSTSFLWAGSMVQHEALLSRQMKQAQSAFVRLGAGFISICLAISLALVGYGYWALVGQELARSFLLVAGVWLFCPWRPGLPYWKEDIRGLLRFGADMTLTQVFCAVISNIDRLLVGKFFGASTLGMYRQAQQLIITPIDQLNGPINSVMQPGLSILQDDAGRYRRYYEKTVRLIGFISMPIAGFCAIFAGELTRIVLGEKWMGAVPVLRIFALSALIRPVLGTAGMVLITCGRSRRLLAVTSVSQVTFLLFLVLGVRGGAQSVALAYVLTPAILLLPNLYFSFAGSPINIGTFFQAIRTPVLATGVMCVALFVYRGVSPATMGIAALVSACIAGGTLYLASYFLLPRGKQELQALFFDITTSLRRRNRPEVSVAVAGQ
jgi:PST family polysaccharide transporter